MVHQYMTIIYKRVDVEALKGNNKVLNVDREALKGDEKALEGDRVSR